MPNITLNTLETFTSELVNSRARMSIAAAKRVVNEARAAEGSDSGGSEAAA